MRVQNLSINEIHQSLINKRFSALELVHAYIENINKLENKIDALLETNFDDAVKNAEKIDRLISQNQKIPILSGIPVVIKDAIVTKGLKTTAGSKVIEDFIPVYDATVIKKLKDNNAIILAKSNCDEFAMGSSTENSAFKVTKNPHDYTRVPGGSSGGSAAAVSADFAPFALGSDTGGSIRQPASICGIVGLKPTYGRVSRYGLIAMGSSLDQIGPMTKSVEDTALVLNQIAGQDEFDATSVNLQVPDFTKYLNRKIKGLKIGIPKQFFGKGLDTNIRKVILKAFDKLESLGAEMIDVSLPHQEYALAVYYLIMPAEVSSNLARFDGIRYGLGRQYFGDEPKRRIMLGTYALSSGYYDQYYNKAAKVRNLIKNDFDKAFKKVDVIAGPTSPSVAWKIGEKINDPLKMYLSDIYTVPVNLTGLPAISIPAGQVNNLPVGLQIIGPYFREDLILQVAHSYEQGKN